MITILFDLDGTLLPNDQEYFLKTYFKILSNKFVSHGYNPELFLKAISNGLNSMTNNDGSKTNEKIFWDAIDDFLSDNAIEYKKIFDEFYQSRGLESIK